MEVTLQKIKVEKKSLKNALFSKISENKLWAINQKIILFSISFRESTQNS